MAATMKMMTSCVVCLLIAAVHFVMFGNAQRECEQPGEPTEDIGIRTLYRVAYNFNSDGVDRACFYIINDRTNPLLERGAFRYKKDGSVVQGMGRYVIYLNQSRSFIFESAGAESPEPIPVHYDNLSNGVVVVHMCTGEQENIIVMYPYGRDLEEAAREEALQMTMKADDYKVDWSDCD